MNDNYLVRQLLGSVRRSALFIVFVAIFLNIGIGVSWFTITRLEERTPKYIPSRANVPIEQDDLNDPIGIQSQKLTVNAQLQVNGQFYLAPSTLPADAKAGTIVFDQATNSLQYYDGNDFTQVASQKTVEALPQVAVTSLQGQSGAINFAPGAGININGTTISNSGLLGINGVAGNINVTTANGIASISLPQAIDPNATPTFNSINLSAPLPVTSGGTGVNNFNQYSLLVGNGTGPLTVTATAGSAGLCLISNNLAAPSFQACPGGVGGSSVTATTPGTANRIAKFTAGTDIGDSSITDNGSLVSVGAPVTINGGVTTTGIFSVGTLDITPGSALTVGAINQQFTLQGSSTSTITARSGSNTTTLDFQTPTSNSTITFPTEAGVVCLRNSTNCGFSTTGSGVSSVNTLTGAVTIQGTTNQVGVTVGSNIVLSTPQDIGTASNVQFNNLTLGGNLTVGPSRTVFANNISQTAPGQPVTISATSDGITFTAYGKNFTFDSSSLGANQTICTSGVNCVAGGGTAVNLAPVGAQIDNTTSSSININKTNATGNILQLQRGGSDVAVLGNSGIFSVNTITPISGTFTLGSTSNTTIVNGSTASEFRIGGVVYRFDASAVGGPYNICTTAANCSGLTGAVTTPGGTTGRLPKFTGSQAISDSILSESGSVITANNGSLVLQGGAGLTLGVSGGSGATGRVDFKNTTNSNTVTLQSGITSVASLTFTLPAADGGSNQCIKTNGSGVLGFGDCLSGSGGGGGVTSLNTLSGSVTLQGSSANRVTVSGAGPIVIDLPQDIATTSAVNFGTLNLNGTASAGLSVGSVGSTGRIVLSDGDATPQTVTFLPATLGANKTITIPNFTGPTATLPVTASGNVAVDSNGNIALTGTIPVGSGGTGGTTQATARSGIGAAASGSNSDITSTSALNTITPSGTFNLGAAAYAFTLQGNASSVITATGGSFTTTIGFAGSPVGNVTYNFDRNPIGGAGTYTVCTTTGNCLGGGAGGANTTLSNLGTVALNSDLLPGVAGARNLGSAALPFGNLYIGSAATNNFTISGTASASRTITLSDNGGTLALLSPTTQQTGNLNTSGTITSGNINGQTISSSANFTGGLTVQGVAGLTLGVGSSASGQLVFKNSTNANNTKLSSGTPSGDIAFTLPSTTGSNGQCLQTNGSGVLSFVNCLSGSGGGSGGVTGLNGLSGALTITTADATNKISVTPSGSNIQLDLPQAINTTSNVTFASLTLSSALSVGNGGTGAASFTSNGILYGAGTGAVQATGSGATGQCLTGNTGSAPTWGSCGAGVAGMGTIDTNGVGANGATIQSGLLYMQSASASAIGLVNTTTQSFVGVKTFTSGLSISTGSTFTNASSSLFTALSVGNATVNGNFGGVTDGTTTVNVATTFNVNQTTAGLTLTLPSPLPTTAGRIVYVNNIGSASFTMHGVVIAPNSTSQFMWNGSAWINEAAGGDVLQGGNSFGTIMRIGTNDAQQLNLIQSGVGRFLINGTNYTLGGTGNKTLTVGSALSGGQSINITAGYTLDGNGGDLVLNAGDSNFGTRGNVTIGNVSNTIQLGNTTGAATQAINIGNNASSGSTTTLTLGSNIGASTTTIQGGTGSISLRTTGNILLGTSDTTGTQLVLDTKTSAGDPTGVNGGTYYNSSSSKFRCFEGSLWKDCISPTASSLTWTARTSAADVNWRDVAYGDGMFIAIASGTSQYMTSTDGVVWTARSLPSSDSWQAVTYGNGVFVIVASFSVALYSSDGINWTTVSHNLTNAGAIAYGNNRFVVINEVGSPGSASVSVNGGITWTTYSVPQAPQTDIAYGNGRFVASGSGNGSGISSADGITWTSDTSISTTTITYGNGSFVATHSLNSTTILSSNGTSWTNATNAIYAEDLTYGNGVYVGVASNSISTSTDGNTWTTSTAPANNSWRAVTYGNGVFVAVANSGTGNRVMTAGANLVVPFTSNNVYHGGMTIYGNVVLGSSLPVGNNNTQVCRSSTGVLATCTSSERFKDNVENLNLGLDQLRLLQPVSYTWKSDGREDIGFIAEQVALVIPQAVTYDENGEVASFNYNTISSLLTASVKQLDLKVTALETRIAKVESGQFSGNLTVAGNAQVNGNLTIQGITQLNDLAITGNTNVQNITVNGKIISKGSVPTVALGQTLSAVLGASISNSGTDTAGTVELLSGTQASAGGEIAVLTFDQAYANAPKIVISGNNAKSAKLGAYVVRTATGFKIVTDDPLQLNQTYSFDYIILEATN